MPSEGFRRRRRERRHCHNRDASASNTEGESMKDNHLKKAPELDAKNDECSFNGCFPEVSVATTSTDTGSTYAEQVKIKAVPIWRIPGQKPSPPKTSGWCFQKIEKSREKTLLDFKTETDSNKTTVYIPPPLRNQKKLVSSSSTQMSGEDILHNEQSEDLNVATEGFWDLDLVSLSKESFDQTVNDGENLAPLTNYTANLGLDEPTSTMSHNEVIPKSGKSHRIKHRTDILEDLTSPLNEVNSVVEPTPGIYVFPFRMVNFANVRVQFAINVLNIPEGIQVTPELFEGVAESPAGVVLPCIIAMDTKKTMYSQGMMECFQGQFVANEETGLYHLQVRLTLPMVKYRQNFGVLGDESTVLVSRNYFHESEKKLNAICHLNFNSTKAATQIRVGNPAVAKPWGLICDKSTNKLYYSERMGNEVACVDPETNQTLFHFDQRRHSLNQPTGIAFDETHRRVLICDKNNHQICYYTSEGQYIGAFGGPGNSNGMLRFPWDVDVSTLGHVAVTDSMNRRIQLFDQFGNYMAHFPLIQKDYMPCPLGITFGHDGQLIYTTDFHTQNILAIPLNMENCQQLNSQVDFVRPQGLVADETGSILVADARNNCVNQLFVDGTHLGTIRNVGQFTLQYPVNLTMMQGGKVAVMDNFGRIWYF